MNTIFHLEKVALIFARVPIVMVSQRHGFSCNSILENKIKILLARINCTFGYSVMSFRFPNYFNHNTKYIALFASRIYLTYYHTNPFCRSLSWLLLFPSFPCHRIQIIAVA